MIDPNPDPDGTISSDQFDTVAEAIAAVPENGTLALPDDSVIEDELVIDKPMTLSMHGSTVTGKIAINATGPVTMKDGTLAYKDADGAKGKNTVGISVTGTEPVTFENCVFDVEARTAVQINTSGETTFDGCTFNVSKTGVYNMIETSPSSAVSAPLVSKFTLKDCKQIGEVNHNFLSLYRFAEGAEVNIIDCTLEDANMQSSIRISNVTSATATINLKNYSVNYAPGQTPEGGECQLLCQDYTKNTPQDFTKITVNFDNFTVDGTKVMSSEGASGIPVYAVYNNGYITGQGNDPVVTFK